MEARRQDKLGILCALPLPDSCPIRTGADVGVRLWEVECTRLETTTMGIRFRPTAEECCLIHKVAEEDLAHGIA